MWYLSWGQVTHCRRQTSVLAGTVFHRTRSPLRLWFLAAWELTSQKYGANALGLQRVLGLGSYKTAWVWPPQAPPGHGPTGARPAERRCASGRELCRGRGGWSAGPRDDQEGHRRDRRRGRRTQDRENTAALGARPSPLRFCEASSRIASHRQARCIPTDGQAIRDSPNWAFATRSRTSRPPAIPRTCSCRPYIGWRLSSSAGSSEPSKEGSPANTSPTIWTSSPFASTDAHPGLAACCSTACLSRLFSVLPRQLRPFTSAPDVGNGPQSPGNHYILGSVDLRGYPLSPIFPEQMLRGPRPGASGWWGVQAADGVGHGSPRLGSQS